MKSYILAIDQGTTSTRAIVFDKQGQIIGSGQEQLALTYPQNGWVEQSPDDIWKDTQAACRQALQHAGLSAQDIAAIGITNQRETTIVWDRKTGEPIYNAIVWQDRRTAEFCKSIEAHEAVVQEKTGLLIDPYFSATKIRWILDNVEGAREKDLAFGTVDSFLLWKMTKGKVHATDATNASRTLLFNIQTQEWDEDLLKLFDIPRAMLPDVCDNSSDFGETEMLGETVPICGIAGDQQAALVGQACFEPGMMKSTYGTGCFALTNIGDTFRLSKNRLLTTIAYRLNGKTTYAIEGAIFIAGAAVQWLRDGLGIVKSSGDTEAMALSVKDNAGVYLVPAFTGLGAPYWDPLARGAIVGLTRGATAAHVARAALEAQAYQTQDLMAAMIDDTKADIAEIRVDGGMVKNNWVCEFLAGMTERPVLRPKVIETTALGAAYLAGLQVGIYKSLSDISQSWRLEKRFDPNLKSDERDRLYKGWQKAVESVLTKS